MEASKEPETTETGGQQPDAAGTETAPVAPTTDAPAPDREAHSDVPETEPDAGAGDAGGDLPVGDEPASEGEGEGILAGTATERAPGVGGVGDHPAPAAVVGEDGRLHVAGEPPAGTIAPGQAPVGDEADEQAGDVTDEEARERLNAVTEPEPIETERPDIGTE